MSRGVVAVLTLIGMVAIGVAACGGDDDEEPTDTSGPTSSIRIEATDNVYDVQPATGDTGRIEAPANAQFEVTLVNGGENPHDIDFYDEEGGNLLSNDANGSIIVSGDQETFTFTTPSPGTYYFVCSVHPTEMFGEFVVE